MSAVVKGLSVAQYLEHEARTGEKHEYFQGEIFAMVGGTPRHALITANFLREASQRLKDRPCAVFSGDLRIKIQSARLYTYPDASIVCGELQMDSDIPNTVLNPCVLVEVLSDSTERYDRGQKSSFYRSIASLQTMVLISQDRPHVECLTRRAAKEWLFTETENSDGSLVLEPIGVSIPLSELYRNVQFDSMDR